MTTIRNLPPWSWLLLTIVLITAWRFSTHLLLDLPLFVDEAQYWYWSQHLDWGYYSKPPMIAVLIRATTGVCGDTELCVRLGSLLLHPLTSVVVYHLARRLDCSPSVAAWCAIAFLTLPAIGVSSMVVSTDVILFLVWSSAMLAFLLAMQTNAWRWWLVLAALAGLGLQTKYTMGIFAFAALGYLWSSGRLRLLLNPRLVIAIVLAALVWLPNLWWNANHEFITFRHTYEISEQAESALKWDDLGAFWAGQVLVIGPVFFVVWIFAGAAMLLRRSASAPGDSSDYAEQFLNWFCWVYIFIISAQALTGGAYANWAAPAYIAAIVLVARHLSLPRLRRWLKIGIAVNLLAISIVYYYVPVAGQLGIRLARGQDVYARVRGWRELGQQFARQVERYPEAPLLGNSRHALALLYYYARPAGLVSFNPGGTIRHHFDLHDSLGIDRIPGCDASPGYLLVLENSDPLSPEKVFDQVTELPALEVRTHPDAITRLRSYHVCGRAR